MKTTSMNPATTAKQNLTTKLTHLKITSGKTKDIWSSGIKSRIDRQKDMLQVFAIVAEKARMTLEEIKIAGGKMLAKLRPGAKVWSARSQPWTMTLVI